VLLDLDTYGPIISNMEAKRFSKTPMYRGTQKAVIKVYTALRLACTTTGELCTALVVGKPVVRVTIRDLGQEVHCASWKSKFSSWNTKQPEKYVFV
jgi:hypothetical protein